MTKPINAATEALIKSWEKLKLTSYKDGGGVWTIGWGHTTDKVFAVKPGQKIDQATAQRLFESDIKEAVDAVDAAVKVRLTGNQRGAVISFAFNVGVRAFRGSTLLKEINRGNLKAVPTQLLRWVNDNGKFVQGLMNRRRAEIALWNTPDGVMTGSTIARVVGANEHIPDGIPSGQLPVVSIWTKPETIATYATTAASALPALGNANTFNLVVLLGAVLLGGLTIYLIRRRSRK
jgi:GH24 family phage-related lysozyme (muramidase)